MSDSFDKIYLSKPKPDGSYLAVGNDEFSKGKLISLEPGEWKELFYGTIQISSAVENIGAGYRESMSGDCSCEAN